jgi:hypothetical protein
VILRSTLLVVLLCFFYSNLKAECTTETLGLCTPGTTTESSTTETIDTIIQNLDSGDLLDTDNGYVVNSKDGSMDSDWGGEGPASMPSGDSCYELGTDKCAGITGSGSTTSTMGVEGMGTTFIQTIDISNLTIDKGGEVRYTIEVYKQDSQDRIYMHVTGSNGKTSVFSGTDILSETGATTGYQSYYGNFDFAGSLNTIIVEIGGRNINLAIGPLFDDVSINVFYNVVSTIVTQHIQSIEEFLTLDYEQDMNQVAEAIFENNDVTNDFNFEPIDKPMDEFSYESVETEMQEFEMVYDAQFDVDTQMDMPSTITMMPEMNTETPMEMTMASIEMELDMQMEMDLPMPEPMEVDIEPTTEEPTMDMQKTMEDKPTMETDMDAEPEQMEEPKQEPEPEVKEEIQEPESEEMEQDVEEEPKEIEQGAEEEPEPEVKEETKEEIKEEPKPEPSAKQKAATKIVKDMGDKGRYEENNQLKTLIVMQVLGNTKSFFETQMALQDTVGFFTDTTLPDNIISDNNMASYLMITDSNGTFNQIVDSQYQ